ncbi:MAG: thiamine diphosphokinase [Eubacterium sp.]
MGTQIKKCVIISGAPENDIEYYNNVIGNSFIISADSGYQKCIQLKIKPNLIIGDFDSSSRPDTDIETIVLPVMKNDTDTFFCVKEAIKRGFNKIIIIGGIGSRIDHTYANILCLEYCLDKGIDCELVNKYNRALIVKNQITINNNYYKYFSLFALHNECEGLTIKGAVYNVDNISLNPNEQFTQSNMIKYHQAEISIKKGKILLIQSND